MSICFKIVFSFDKIRSTEYWLIEGKLCIKSQYEKIWKIRNRENDWTKRNVINFGSFRLWFGHKSVSGFTTSNRFDTTLDSIR